MRNWIVASTALTLLGLGCGGDATVRDAAVADAGQDAAAAADAGQDAAAALDAGQDAAAAVDAGQDAAAVDPGPIALGDSSLGATGTFEEGEIVTLLTDGSVSFGNAGPTLALRMTLAGQADGDPLDISRLEGDADFTDSDSLDVEAVPGLPYGLAVRIGTIGTEQNSTGTPRIRATHDLSTEIYEALTIYWPADHQDASRSQLNATSTWQIKSIWHYRTSGGYGSEHSNWWGYLPAWSATGLGFSNNGRLIGSNASDSPRGNINVRDPLDRYRWRATPMYRQIWARHAPDSTSVEGSDGMVRFVDSASGVLSDYRLRDNARWNDPGTMPVGVDRFTIPGYVRGFHTLYDRHVFYSDIYIARSMGPGAAARVEIGDAPVYEECLNLSVFNIESWSDTEVRARVRKGIFFDRGLSGLSLFVTDAENNTTLVGTFP